MLTAKTETAKHVISNDQPKTFSAILSEFRRNLADAIQVRGLTYAEAAEQLNTSVQYLQNLSIGTQQPGLEKYFQIPAWMSDPSAPSVCLSGPKKPAPEASLKIPEQAAPPSYPQSKALLAWMNLHYALLHMHITPVALFDQSVEVLNAYFSGYDKDAEKETCHE
ncbi:hypothetical protein [Turicimonas muris]|uniref:hypothetical protein n=1 Tax=Turicimonas muris TaxID=1796652 RepID=UPI002494CE39|nr:hypothetical protein [Turicimonas muris]